MANWICGRCGSTYTTNDPKKKPTLAGCKDKSGKPIQHTWRLKK